MQNKLSRLIVLIRRWAWLVILGACLCGGITYLLAKLLPPTYQASAVVIITVQTSQSANDNTLASLSLLPTFAQIATHPQVLQPVADAHNLTLKQLSDMVIIKQQSNTQILQIDVRNPNAYNAALLANEIAKSFINNYLTPVYEHTIGGNILPARPPVIPTQPKPLQDGLIGALVGLALAASIVTVLEWMGNRVTIPDEIPDSLGLDVLAIIPKLRPHRQRSTDDDTQPIQNAELAENCRMLCANLTLELSSIHGKLLLITSALPDEGKSTLAVNIAAILAASGKRVLLVDADLRHPLLDQHFHLKNQHGLSQILCGDRSGLKILEGQPTAIPSLHVLTSGAFAANPSEVLQSSTASFLFEQLRITTLFDYIIFDAPPVLPVADAQILATYIPTTLLVVDASKTSRLQIEKAKRILHRTGTHLLGVVLNKSLWPASYEMRDFVREQQHLFHIAKTQPSPQEPALRQEGEQTDLALPSRQHH